LDVRLALLELNTLNCNALEDILVDFIDCAFSLVVNLLILNAVIFPFVVLQSYYLDCFIDRQQLYNIKALLIDDWEGDSSIFNVEFISQVFRVEFIECPKEKDVSFLPFLVDWKRK
jgi:hypothetical protein